VQRFKLLILGSLLLLSFNLSFAQESSEGIQTWLEEEDGSPSVIAYKIKVTNASLTDNADGTASLSISGGSVSDTAYDASTWDGVTDVAPSKNAVRDKIESLAGGHDAVTLDANADTLLSLSTQELGLDTQAANKIFGGPAAGAAAVPTFRALVDDDIPDNITITETDPNALLLDQTAPQDIINGSPNFLVGIDVGSTGQLGIDSSGNLTTTGTIQAEHLKTTDDLEVANDILLGSGSVINFNSGNATITHSDGALTFNVFPVTPSAAPDADYEVANKKYVDDNIAGGGATKALDNLTSVAINTSLVSDTADTDDLGSTTKEWANLYMGDVGKIYLGLGQDTSINRSAANELTITASSGVKSTTFIGALTGNVNGNVSGSSGSCTGNAATATLASTITTTDNENTAENNLIPFVADAAGPGSSALETDGDFYYNPSTGKITATGFVGSLTGNADTVTNATLTTALTVNTGTVTLTGNVANDSVLTIGSGAVGVSGSNTGDQTITLTGDVTGAGSGSFAATIANDAVTYAKMQNVSATDKILGRSSAGAGDVEEITCTSAGRAILDDEDAPAQRTTLGLVIGTNVLAPNGDGANLTNVLHNIVEDTMPQLGGALDGQGNDLNNLGVIFLTEQASAEADVAGKGQIWVKTATPNELYFTDDAGTDARVVVAGGAFHDGFSDFVANEHIDWTNASSAFSTSSTISSSGLTASEILATDADKKLSSLAVETYPSLTELSYVKGVSSAIQTQLGNKLESSDNIVKQMAIHFTLDGSGSAITTGAKSWVRVPFACTLTGWELTVDTSATITIDVWKDTYANYPPDNADAMPGAEKEPAITAAIKAQDTDITDWTTDDIAAGDYIKINVDANDNATKAYLTLYGNKT
jgi:hypothetical protein